MTTRTDRRRFPRVRLDGRLSGKVTVEMDFRVITLSETGATIALPIPLHTGSRCDLVLRLAHVAVDLHGEVVHLTLPEKPGDPFLVGVRFDRSQQIDRVLLESFLERERRKSQ